MMSPGLLNRGAMRERAGPDPLVMRMLSAVGMLTVRLLERSTQSAMRVHR